MNTDKLLSSRTVRSELGEISEMTVWRWVQDGILPQPVKINRRNYWHQSDIERVKLGETTASGKVAA